MFVPLAVLKAPESRPVVQPRRISLNRTGHWGIWILSIWSWVILWPGLLMAAGPPADDAASHPPVAQPVVPADQSTVKTTKIVKPPTREQKRKVVVVTSIVIAGILTILLCMLLWIVWWSRRTHRLLRAPLPAANRGDELWYLKAKRPPHPTADNPAPDSPPAPPQA